MIERTNKLPPPRLASSSQWGRTNPERTFAARADVLAGAKAPADHPTPQTTITASFRGPRRSSGERRSAGSIPGRPSADSSPRQASDGRLGYFLRANDQDLPPLSSKKPGRDSG